MSNALSSSGALPWMLPRHGKGRGSRDGVKVRDGFFVVRTDVIYDEGAHFRFECPGDDLRLHFKLSGECAISADDEEYRTVESGHISIVTQPADSIKYERVKVGTQERSVTLVCQRAFLAQVVTSPVELPGAFDRFAHDSVDRLSCHSAAIPASIRPIVEDLVEPPDAGSFGSLLVEAKALELLGFALRHLAGCAGRITLVRERDRRKVRDLCALIEENPSATLSIAEMCRLIAWNETQLMECFKRVTGDTIFNYRHQLRMRRALNQLRHTDARITEIAFDAGYEHPCNFATAFRRAFGIPPTAARTRSTEHS